MLDAFWIAAAGFLLGLRHATDADHVVAVTAIVAREPQLRRAAAVGALWGIGHSLTILVVGGLLVALRVTVPTRVELSLELGVAAMLILLGFRNLRGADGGHAHGHGHGPGRDTRRGRLAGTLRPVLIGTVHGLAGSAAVALLVLATIRSTAGALAYLGVFGVGTIAGMVLVTVLLAAPTVVAGARVARFQRGIRVAAGVASVGFGVWMGGEILQGW